MNNTVKHTVALEISSSKIIGTVGYTDSEGRLIVSAIDQEEIKDYVRYGIIQNPEEVSIRVNRLIGRLNNSPAVAPAEIRGLYVGLSGRSLKSIKSDVKFEFPDEMEITDEILEKLQREATKIEIGQGLEIVDVAPRSYIVDKMETTSPKGTIGKSISAIFDVIVCRQDLKRNINRAISDRLKLDIEGYVVTPLAVSNIVLREEEKRLGCMLVDFGAETTTVCIFRKGELYYYNTIPLGSRAITLDITSLSLLEERAEEIKRESGRAVMSDTPSNLNINGLKHSDVSNLVVARAEEIVANVINQIYYAGLKEKDLPEGIICVGAGSNLNGILELIETHSSLNARMGHLPSFITSTEPRAKRLEALQVISVLYKGCKTDGPDCLETQQNDLPESDLPAYKDNNVDKDEEQKPNKVGKFFNSISRGLSNFFAPQTDDDDSELD